MKSGVNATHVLEGHDELKKLVENGVPHRDASSVSSFVARDFEAIEHVHNLGYTWREIWSAYKIEIGSNIEGYGAMKRGFLREMSRRGVEMYKKFSAESRITEVPTAKKRRAAVCASN